MREDEPGAESNAGGVCALAHNTLTQQADTGAGSRVPFRVRNESGSTSNLMPSQEQKEI